ncbi:MAG: hypothetical protein RLW42_12870 [Gammaproteobacteria bacterium]
MDSTVDAVIAGALTDISADGMLSVTATDATTASASATALNAAAGVAASGAVAVADTGGTATAAILDGAIVGATNVTVDANGDASQTATAGGFTGSVIAGAGVMIAETLAGQSAHAEASGTITANALDLTANADRNGAAEVLYVGISLVTGEVSLEAEQTAGDTTALVGADADLTISGHVNVSAVSDDRADPDLVSLGVGVATLGASASMAEIRSNTRAGISGRVRADSADVTATADKVADASGEVNNFGLVSLNGVALQGIADKLPGGDLPVPILPPFDTVTSAFITGTTEAYLGTGADITTDGALTVQASGENAADAISTTLSVSLVAVSETGTEAVIEGCNSAP